MLRKIPHLRWFIAFSLLFAAVLNYIDRSVLGLLANTIQKDLGISNDQYATVVNWFLVAYTLAYLFSGRVVDKIGVRLSLALLGAFLGGLLLNLMPCVFPVLAIKVLGFARHGADRRAHRISGLAYSAGVVLSFVALGALMLVLRSAGEQLGWGFQLQSPAVVAALAVLFTVLALNLAGLFEFGTLLPSRVATLEARHPGVNAFLSGVLAVAIASPCTAPFMGASLGYAIALPALQALLNTLMLAEADPPADAGGRGTLLLARIDELEAQRDKVAGVASFWSWTGRSAPWLAAATGAFLAGIGLKAGGR